MRTLIRTLALALLLPLPAAMQAQNTVNVLTYKLEPDDLIEISVPNHQDLKYAGPVPPGGKVSLPEVGVVTLVGKTCSQLETELAKKISEFRNNVTVDVILVEARSKQVQIIGSTLKVPGKYTMRPGWRLFDLVSAAGGVQAKPNKIAAKLVRGGKAFTLSYQGANDKPDSDDNVALQPGDLVLLDEVDVVHYYVNIIGEVASKKVVELDPDLDLYRLVLMGQPTEFANLAKAHILRANKEIPINLSSINSATPDDTVKNFKLEKDDTLYIPRLGGKYAVLGSVGKPGPYPLPDDKPLKVLDAFVLAGGSSGGDTARAGLVRTGGKKAELIPLNLDAILKKADLSKDIPLQDGDVLYVPPRGQGGFRIENLVTPLYLLRFIGL